MARPRLRPSPVGSGLASSLRPARQCNNPRPARQLPSQPAALLLGDGAMSDENVAWRMVEYEGFEIHVATPAKEHPGASAVDRSAADGAPYTYIGYVCHPGA